MGESPETKREHGVRIQNFISQPRSRMYRMMDSLEVRITDTADGRLDLALRNIGEKKVYDIVKLYVDDHYAGFDYLDLEPGDTVEVGFDIGHLDIAPASELVVTTHDQENGVLLSGPFQDMVGDGVSVTPSTGQESGPQASGSPGNGEEEHHGYVSSLIGSFFGHGSAAEPVEAVEQSQRSEEQEPVEEQTVADPAKREPLPSEMVDRVSTGIIGLDDKMQGGLVEGTMNLVTGKTGTGKTAFCASFLKRGADLDEPGVYVTTEERKEDIREDIRAMFGWDFEQLEEAGKIKVLSIKPIFPSKEIENLNRLVRSYITDLLDNVRQAVDDLDADRVVIDSVSLIEMFIRDEYMARVALSSLLNNLREAGVTAVLTGTVPETSEGLSGGGIIEFLVDAVLLLEFVPVAEEHKRTLTIRKMRRTDHAVEIFPFDITPDGIKIFELH